MTIPVQAGPLTLLYPQWLPGNHAPRGELDKLAGLTFQAGGRVLPWTRDPADVYAFHLDVDAVGKRPCNLIAPDLAGVLGDEQGNWIVEGVYE